MRAPLVRVASYLITFKVATSLLAIKYICRDIRISVIQDGYVVRFF